ncbi:hypothetical protein [Methanocella conradii]|uniref:hypothetical protein n=1 Tax=Methanocella conradii TaxID=1175444 RepID=UPI0024B34726|nr:hypothetical protein [Methanocella conradii]MDI6896527.1 hypothetical protein [Methanocella conradii]
MEDRSLLSMAAIAVVGLVVLAALLAAGYMLVSAIFGPSSYDTAQQPTFIPAAPTSTPYATVPTGQFIPGGSQPGGYPAVPTPVQPVVKRAEFVDGGTDKDTYRRGDTAIAYIIIKNTGTVPIDEAKLHVSVAKFLTVAYMSFKSSDTPLTGLGVQPGETKKVEYSIAIPDNYKGIPTAGKYKITVDVYVWDTKIGAFEKEIEIQQ